MRKSTYNVCSYVLTLAYFHITNILFKTLLRLESLHSAQGVASCRHQFLRLLQG